MENKKFWKQILSFNFPVFVIAGIVTLMCIVFLAFFNLPQLLDYALVAVIAGTLWFSICSLFFSYLIYDRSDLYRFQWLKPYLQKGKKIFNIYSGYSEAGHLLNEIFPHTDIIHVDFFDKAVSVTGSIKRAQKLSVPLKSITITPDDFLYNDKADVILFMQSLHELRTAALKSSMLKNCSAHLKPCGRIIIAEHLCDLNNFLIYGPGAFHFFGNSHWNNVIHSSGLLIESTFTITPFVKIYILKSK